MNLDNGNNVLQRLSDAALFPYAVRLTLYGTPSNHFHWQNDVSNLACCCSRRHGLGGCEQISHDVERSIEYLLCFLWLYNSLNYWLYPPSNDNGFLSLDPRQLNHVLPPEKNVSCFTQLNAWRIKQNTSLLGISLLVDKVSSCAMNRFLMKKRRRDGQG